MEPYKPAVFTPFLRRFTDERARDLGQLRTLYNEVRSMHFKSRYAAEGAAVDSGTPVYAHYIDQLPESLITPFCGVLNELTRLEQTIFEFPEIKWDVAQLSLKEQVDLERFLTAKRHFLVNEERVMDMFYQGLRRLFDTMTEDLPEFQGPSPFTIPLINTLPEPKKLIDRIYAIIWTQGFIDNGLFVELGRVLHANICAASGITDPLNPKQKPFKIPSENPAPIADVVNIYLKNTVFEYFLMSPVPLKLSYEDRYSHMHIVGGSGAGKTQLLQHLILHDLQSEDPPALVIVDSQTDLIQKISHLDLFHPETGRLRDRLTLITPRDIKNPPALNIFDVNKERLGQYDEATKEQVTAGVIQTFDYLFTGLVGADLTAKQDVFFRFVARLMLALPETMGRNATILDLIYLMEDPEPYAQTIRSLPPIQRNFFERDFLDKKNTTFKQTKEQVRYRLNAILENPTLARLFTSPSTKIDLFSALNNNAIILVDTSKDFLKGSSAHFGRIFISLVLQAVLERAAIPEDERKPAFLIVDEAADYFDSNINDLLTEARKFKVGCVFAHQYLDQATHLLRSSLAASTSIKMASGVSTSDARSLAPDLRTTAEFILSQPKLSFAAHIRNVTQQAVSIPVPAGAMEREPKLSRDAYERLLAANRTKVSLGKPSDVALDGTTPKPEAAGPMKPADDPGTKTTPDW